MTVLSQGCTCKVGYIAQVNDRLPLRQKKIWGEVPINDNTQAVMIHEIFGSSVEVRLFLELIDSYFKYKTYM